MPCGLAVAVAEVLFHRPMLAVGRERSCGNALHDRKENPKRGHLLGASNPDKHQPTQFPDRRGRKPTSTSPFQLIHNRRLDGGTGNEDS